MRQESTIDNRSSLTILRRYASRTARCVFRWTRNILALVGFVFLLFKACFELTVVVSESMSPTLQGTSYENGDWVLTEKVTYKFRKPRRWEVIACRQEDGTRVMKRVAGLPGEYVSMRNHTVLIDGVPVVQPAELESVEYLAYGNLHHGQVVPCGDGFYVLGDLSWDSNDSRFEGPVPKERVRGRALAVIWPLSRAGWVN